MAQCSNCDWPYKPNSGACPNCGHEGCFITTAVCEFKGLADDCHELTSLRSFRDRHMKTCSAKASMLNTYYEVAPHYVGVIDQRADRAEIYQTLNERFIQPAVVAADSGDDLKAENLYTGMMSWIEQRLSDPQKLAN